MTRDEADQARERLHILDAMLTVIERRSEFMTLVGESTSADIAGVLLQADWGMTDAQAAAALDLQVRRFAAHEAALLAAERDELVRQILAAGH